MGTQMKGKEAGVVVRKVTRTRSTIEKEVLENRCGVT